MKWPAPLVVLPDEPAPRGEVRGYEGARGFGLRAALFRPEIPVRGSVILSPGRTEIIEKYYEVIGELTARGFVVLVHDWRGQGGSQRLLEDRLAGHADTVDDFLDDYHRLLAAFAADLPPPWIALGHSMGGALTLLAVEDGAGPMDAVVLSAPMLCLRFKGLAGQVAGAMAWGMVAAGRGARAVPGVLKDPLEDHFGDDGLTHDHDRYLHFKRVLRAEPSMALGHPTWGWLKFALEAMRRVRAPRNLARVTTPVLIVTAGADRICQSPVAARVAALLPHGRCREIPGAYHEILMETDEFRAEFWRAFDAFVAPIAAPSPPPKREPARKTATVSRTRSPSAPPRRSSSPQRPR